MTNPTKATFGATRVTTSKSTGKPLRTCDTFSEPLPTHSKITFGGWLEEHGHDEAAENHSKSTLGGSEAAPNVPKMQ